MTHLGTIGSTHPLAVKGARVQVLSLACSQLSAQHLHCDQSVMLSWAQVPVCRTGMQLVGGWWEQADLLGLLLMLMAPFLPSPWLRLAQSLIALFASSLAISVVFAIIPLCHNVVLLAVVMAVAGLAMGCIDTIANMQLVKIYQKDSAVFLQVRRGCWPPRQAEVLQPDFLGGGGGGRALSGVHLSSLPGPSLLRGLWSPAEPADS